MNRRYLDHCPRNHVRLALLLKVLCYFTDLSLILAHKSLEFIAIPKFQMVA